MERNEDIIARDKKQDLEMRTFFWALVHISLLPVLFFSFSLYHLYSPYSEALTHLFIFPLAFALAYCGVRSLGLLLERADGEKGARTESGPAWHTGVQIVQALLGLLCWNYMASMLQARFGLEQAWRLSELSPLETPFSMCIYIMIAFIVSEIKNMEY